MVVMQIHLASFFPSIDNADISQNMSSVIGSHTIAEDHYADNDSITLDAPLYFHHKKSEPNTQPIKDNAIVSFDK